MSVWKVVMASITHLNPDQQERRNNPFYIIKPDNWNNTHCIIKEIGTHHHKIKNVQKIGVDIPISPHNPKPLAIVIQHATRR